MPSPLPARPASVVRAGAGPRMRPAGRRDPRGLLSPGSDAITGPSGKARPRTDSRTRGLLAVSNRPSRIRGADGRSQEHAADPGRSRSRANAPGRGPGPAAVLRSPIRDESPGREGSGGRTRRRTCGGSGSPLRFAGAKRSRWVRSAWVALALDTRCCVASHAPREGRDGRCSVRENSTRADETCIPRTSTSHR